MKESQIEARLVRGAKAGGGMCMKFISPGLLGAPDRIVLTPAGRVIFVELKTENGRLSSIQKWVIGELEKRGAEVRVLKGPEAVKDFLKEVFADEV